MHHAFLQLEQLLDLVWLACFGSHYLRFLFFIGIIIVVVVDKRIEYIRLQISGLVVWGFRIGWEESTFWRSCDILGLWSRPKGKRIYCGGCQASFSMPVKAALLEV